MRLPAAILAAWLAPAAAIAQMPAAPFVTPQHDVDVTYLIPVPGHAPGDPEAFATQRMRWSAGLWRQRLDPPGIAYMITDYRGQTMLVVDPGRGAALLLPAPANSVKPPGVRASGRYARLGEERVAGTPCTEWRTTDDSGATSLVCFTADGVMLRARHGQRILIEAARIRYAPQEASLFEPPPGTRIRSAGSR